MIGVYHEPAVKHIIWSVFITNQLSIISYDQSISRTSCQTDHVINVITNQLSPASYDQHYHETAVNTTYMTSFITN